MDELTNANFYEVKIYPLDGWTDSLNKQELGLLIAAFNKRQPFWSLQVRWYIENSRSHEYRLYVIKNIGYLADSAPDLLSSAERLKMQEFCYGFAAGLKAQKILEKAD
jgi:hypothetical protein